MVKRNPVAAVWAFGLVVAVLAYVLGPYNLLTAITATIREAAAWMERLSFELFRTAAGFIRAAAIGLYAVFVVLALMVLRQGGQAKTALVVVTGLFYLLVWTGEYDIGHERWFLAFGLCAISALVMTRKLSK